MEVTITGPGARTITIPEPRPNLMIVSGRHYCRVEVQAEQPRPALADAAKASADELRAVWGPFVGEAGTYEVTGGNVITMRPIAAKNPAAMAPGAFITYSVQTGRRHGLGDAAAEPERPIPQSIHHQSCARRTDASGGSVMTRIRRASLLVVLAHPDDEIFHGGVLAHLSERGVRVTLACATDGEAGKPHPSVGPVDDLGALRVEELELSCARLGIEEPVLLRFHDSARKERQRHDDPHALANVDMLDVEAAIRGIIADVKPQVIVTFDPHGGYYHPDHVAIQRATTAAFFSSGGLGDEAPERLFYATMLRDVFRVFAEASRGRGIIDGLDPDVFAAVARNGRGVVRRVTLSRSEVLRA